MSSGPKFNMGDKVKSSTKEFKVAHIEHFFLKGFMYGPGGLNSSLVKEDELELIEPVDEVAKINMKRIEADFDAKYNPQKYLSKLDRVLDVDEAVKYFGEAALLNEIGMRDAINHFGDKAVKKYVGC